MTAQIKVKVQRKAIVKIKVLPKFPADVEADAGIVITRSGTTYTFSLDLTAGGIQPFDDDLQAIADLTGTGITRRTGDGTWTVGTQVATAEIADDAVTYAKLQNVSATSRVIGRKTASAGDAEECTLSEVLDFIGSAAQGDVLYRGASSWARLGAGTSGNFLRTSGPAANPVWAPAGAPVSSAPIFILSSGESTGAAIPAFVWTPASNLSVWNWDGVDGHTGSAFAAADGTHTNAFVRAASDIAYANPNSAVYLVNISYTGLAIAQWVSGASGVAMWTNITNNMTAALAAAGLTKIDQFWFWQGANDTGFPARWLTTFATLTAQLKAQSWFPVITPMALFEIASNLSSGFAVWDRDAINGAIEAAVRVEPDVRMVVNPNQIGAANYADGLHPSATGYDLVGKLAANTILYGYGRKPSVVVHPASIGAAAESNIIVNGDHEISEENLTTAVTGITSTATYVTDQWAISANGAVVVSGVQTTTGLFDTKNCLRVTVTTVDSSIAAGDYLYVYTPIEGTRLRKLGLGGTPAKNSILGFYVRSSMTGTFGVSVLNVAGTRCWVQTITISAANTWEWNCISIPPEVSGAWVTDSTLAAVVRICLSAGSTYQGTAGAWATSNIMTTSAQTNFSGTNAATFDVTNAIWLAGTDLIEAEHAPLIMLPRQRSLVLCQRYLYVWRSSSAYFGQSGGCASTTQAIIPITLPVEMRLAPTFSTPDATKFSVLDMAGGSQACSTLATTGVAGVQSTALLATVASGLTLGRATVMFANGATAVGRFKSQM